MSEDMAGQVPASPRRLEIWLPIAIVALDQLTKAIVRSAVPLSASVEVVSGFMNITHVRNTGAAFGHVCTPEEVADVVRFLVSDAAGYLTDQKVTIDGGSF